MKTVVVLSMLVLALIGGAGASKENAEPKTEEECKTLCLDKKFKEPICKEVCTINQLFALEWKNTAQCSSSCRDNRGKVIPTTKACEEECKKKFNLNVAKLAGRCYAVCSTEEPTNVEKCNKVCGPTFLYKEMKEKAIAEAKN